MSDDEKIILATKKESKKDKKERKKEKKDKKDKKKSSKENEESGSEDEQSGSDDDDEIAIDLNADIPLSKKQQRLLKKGKLDLAKLKKKNPAPKPELTEEEKIAEAAKEKETKKSPYAVWIGNLAFDTTKEDLVRFIVGKTSGYIGTDDDDELIKIENIDITRINLPKKEKKIKGFAYLDFPSAKHVKSAISLSEQILNGRKLLIKDSTSFEGRPEKDASTAAGGVSLSKNPPSRILFVGNLSFDTSEDNLEEHFRFCGDIVRIRMATFEDSGKCKGFAFIDFKDETGPTTALKSKMARKLINRPLRLEYGEDRSKRNPGQRNRERMEAGSIEGGDDVPARAREREFRADQPPREVQFREREQQPPRERRPAPPKKRQFNDYQDPNKRVKSSVALATAQRASAAIVPSQGKKISFD
ncbi:nucleolar protein 13 [[Candida] railenensis]|uniref:Nucleolar protein 13 n=1 Tax=[Candida] railenensis TaxID=45579 RepID=A0A9P0QTF2_9ASCO|nr:nucleolar protein 13 [[Candida] railenensis]